MDSRILPEGENAATIPLESSKLLCLLSDNCRQERQRRLTAVRAKQDFKNLRVPCFCLKRPDKMVGVCRIISVLVSQHQSPALQPLPAAGAAAQKSVNTPAVLKEILRHNEVRTSRRPSLLGSSHWKQPPGEFLSLWKLFSSVSLLKCTRLFAREDSRGVGLLSSQALGEGERAPYIFSFPPSTQ